MGRVPSAKTETPCPGKYWLWILAQRSVCGSIFFFFWKSPDKLWLVSVGSRCRKQFSSSLDARTRNSFRLKSEIGQYQKIKMELTDETSWFRNMKPRNGSCRSNVCFIVHPLTLLLNHTFHDMHQKIKLYYDQINKHAARLINISQTKPSPWNCVSTGALLNKELHQPACGLI